MIGRGYQWSFVCESNLPTPRCNSEVIGERVDGNFAGSTQSYHYAALHVI